MWRLLCIFAIINVVLSRRTTPRTTDGMGKGATSSGETSFIPTRERRPNTHWSRQQNRVPQFTTVQRTGVPTSSSRRIDTTNSINRMDPMTMLLVASMLGEVGGTGGEMMGLLGMGGGTGMDPMSLLGRTNLGAGSSGSTGGANPLRNMALLQNGSDQLLSLSGMDCMMNPRTASGGVDPFCMMLLMQHPNMGL